MGSASRQSDSLPAVCGGTPVRRASQKLIFGAPCIGETEIDAVAETLRSRWIGSGPRVQQFETEFARSRNAPYAVAVSSGTAALHLALLGLGLGPGDEVIAPSMTFCSTIHAIVHAGATPVLADCGLATFNLDPEAVAKLVTSRTKAIIVVHMGGRCCDMDPLLEIARRHGLRIIEDCAHAIESEHRGRPAGTMGDVGCFSFYPTKSITTGDGGMLITSDRRLARRVRVLSLQGMSRDAWSRTPNPAAGYRVVAAGFKANMTDLEASLGLAQLAGVNPRWQRRGEIWDAYNRRLQPLNLQLPAPVARDTKHAHHLYSVLLHLENLNVGRRNVIAALDAENIGTGIHYVPVHMQPYYRRRYGYRPSDFPNATAIGKRTLSLPIGADLSAEDISDVVRAMEKILHHFSRDAKTPASGNLLPATEPFQQAALAARGRG